ncbi:isocitrate lyase/phosphoenolpyruvate mutase family protein [Alphaproteobacteria bacterium]|nr:isocitrate lyase/phosphoenolpyruvate mutase family protein [Alphaproteobacteria bacterium]
MNWTPRRQRFRQILAGNDCIIPATVFDPLSARMVEDLGGKVGMLAGSVAAMAILGAPDKMLITASEFADMALRICRAGDLAVIADADHGYGNAMNVQRTIRDLDHAGLAAITIEDTNLPQPFGSKTTQLLKIDEAVGKMRAAISGRVDADLVILARTSAATITGRDDCIARIKAYEKTGVDGITLIGARSLEDLTALCAATDLPIMLGGIGSIAATADDLAKMGARICLRGHQPYLASLAATYGAMQQVLGQANPDDAPPVINSAILRQLTREASYDEDADQFLK